MASECRMSEVHLVGQTAVARNAQALSPPDCLARLIPHHEGAVDMARDAGSGAVLGELLLPVFVAL